MMKHTVKHTAMIVCILMFIIEACTFIPVPTRVPTATMQPTQMEFHTVTPSFTEIPTDTLIPTELPTHTSTPTASPTNTLFPTRLPTDIPTSTEFPTDTPAKSPTYTPTSTVRSTDTFTPTALSIDTPTETGLPTGTSTATSTPKVSLTGSITATSSPTPSCPSPAPHAVLSVSAENINVGDILKVTAVLSNEGCGTLGLPQYRLYIQSDGPQAIFSPSTPAPVVHYLGVTSGRPDTVEFELTAVVSGQATLNVGVSFEFHVGYPGPAYWLSAGTQKLIVNVAP